MKTLVVFFAVTAVACGSLISLAQPPYHPAVVLDPHGRPLETADVISARAVHLQAKALEQDASLVHAVVAPVAYTVAAPIGHIAPSIYAVPAAVSHQSRVDVQTTPALVSHSVAAPVIAHAAYTSPLLGHSTLDIAGHGHLLKKRSLATYAIAPTAVSQQSRVDVISSPTVVAHSIATPFVSQVVAAPVVAAAPAAVSHQSRVDVRSGPAVVTHAVAPFVSNVWDATVYGAHALSHGHLLKKRSLAAVVHTVPAAVSHQSRVDVISKPDVAPVIAHAGPVNVAHVAPAVIATPVAVSEQARVDVLSSGVHAVPLAHSAVWSAPAVHWGNAGLLKALW